MKKIKLTRGKYALVADEDFEWLNQWKWFYNPTKYDGYAIRHNPDLYPRYIFMHRLIVNCPNNYETHHLNDNKLDNRRKNLRIVTKSLNEAAKGLSSANKSGYKGVSWYSGYKKWRVVIKHLGIQYNLGHFKSKKDAAKAYMKAAKQYFGEYARLR